MTNFDPRRSERPRPPVGPPPGFGGARWIGVFIILIIVIAIFAWGTGDWWGGNGTNNAGNNAAPRTTTNGASGNAPGVNGAQHPSTTGTAQPGNNSSKP
jgi:hypothetical protein